MEDSVSHLFYAIFMHCGRVVFNFKARDAMEGLTSIVSKAIGSLMIV